MTIDVPPPQVLVRSRSGSSDADASGHDCGPAVLDSAYTLHLVSLHLVSFGWARRTGDALTNVPGERGVQELSVRWSS
jgi:hypothetical protein